jgi:hypothetical protein
LIEILSDQGKLLLQRFDELTPGLPDNRTNGTSPILQLLIIIRSEWWVLLLQALANL